MSLCNACLSEYRGKYSGSTKSQQVNVLITFDPETHRLHVYGTLLTYFPEDPAVRLALYERLLDGALLGKDMCGGLWDDLRSPPLPPLPVTSRTDGM